MTKTGVNNQSITTILDIKQQSINQPLTAKREKMGVNNITVLDMKI